MQRQWLKILFSILLIAIFTIWMSEAFVNKNVNLIDQIAYPIILSSVSISLLVLQWKPQAYGLALLGTVGIIIVYTVTFLQAIIWGYIPLKDHYNLTTFAQWFPLTYILIFLFIRKQQAFLLSVCIYLSLAVPSILIGWQEQDLAIDARKFPYLLHMMMSHPIYIAVFVAVATLQTSFVQAHIQASEADIDHLTNVANRRAATRFLEAMFSQITTPTSQVGVVLIDIDYFKKINDTYGHDVGDRVLIRVAQVLQKELRKTDLVSRWGGEEFLVILTAYSIDEISETAERLRQMLADYEYSEVKQVTASFGVALKQVDEEFEALIKRADKALYQAKQQGRNQVVIAADAPSLEISPDAIVSQQCRQAEESRTQPIS
ncbi:sensor domain-containing diguanylate cyclase [Leptolyngbya sp. PCC 6406]|uniref:GGDEF domain-containing protein n=1 Tax=Leptolyngbya sp. PCC 6406 TaxID=1173264 RepID=UPI0012DC89AF|nr:GGDEF domain-containing protein [Leptolyngbya sp. PCC 6406]